MAHHDSISRRGLFEELHVGRVVPRQLPAFTNRAIFIYRDDSYDHIFAAAKPWLDCYRGRNFSVGLIGCKLEIFVAHGQQAIEPTQSFTFIENFEFR